MTHIRHCIIALTCTLLTCTNSVQGQLLHFYRNDGKHNVYASSAIDSMTIYNSEKLLLHFTNKSTVDIKTANIDSITVGGECLVAQMNIITDEQRAINSKETYVPCSITIDGMQMFPDFNGRARIRGRGNSTWWWYPKKPYRVKLDENLSVMGLKSNKDWVLLANYRDPTFLMNAFSFDLADYLGVPFANNTRFVWLTLNGEERGLYHITEQVEVGGDRVDISEDTDVLLALDEDDKNEPSSFRSVYGMPVCIKSPQDELLTSARKSAIQADFAALENLIKAHNYTNVKARLDLRSLMNFIIIQELTMNVEVRAPRSMYMYRTDDQVWHFGPPWDFDAGFCFDWGQMYTGHNYFGSYTDLIFGNNPAGGASSVNKFFTDMFNDFRFKVEFVSYWHTVKAQLLSTLFTKLENYRHQIEAAMAENYTIWNGKDKNFDKQFATEYPRLLRWIENRFNTVDYAFSHYP